MTYAGARNTRMELVAYGGSITLYNPSDLILSHKQNNRSVETLINKANEVHYTCRGRTELEGWFLVKANDVRNYLPKIWEGTGFDECSIKLTDEAGVLQAGYDPAFGGATTGNHKVTEIKKLYAVESYAVSGVVRADITEHDAEYSRPSYLQAGNDFGRNVLTDTYENQFYLVKVVDYRYWHKLSRYLGSFNIKTRLWEDDSHNVRYQKNSGYSWQTMLDELWGSGGVSALDHSSANYSLEGPINYYFWGVNSLDAFHKVLNDLDHTIVRNLDGTTTVWDMGTDPPSISDQERELYKTELVEVSNDSNGLILPEKIWVLFPKLDYQWQTSSDTEEVTANDYWHNRPVWGIQKDTATLLAGMSGAPSDPTLQSGTNQILHDTLPAQFAARLHGAGEPNEDPAGTGSILPINDTEIQNQATQRATRWIKARLNGDKKIVREVYRGYIPFTPAHDISKIIWKNKGLGAVTIIESCSIASEEDFLPSEGYGGKGSGGEYSNAYDYHEALSRRVVNENPSPPDHARWMEPAFRWAMIEPDADILPDNGSSPHGIGTCSVKYGISSGGDADLTFYTSTKNIEVKNIDTTAKLEQGKYYFAWWNEQMRFWLAVPRSAYNLRGGEICSTVSRGSNLSQTSGKNTATLADYGHDDCIETVKFLRVNKQTMLRSYVRTADYVGGDTCGYAYADAGGLKEEEMLISFNPSRKIGGAVLWSDGDVIRWSRAPKLASYLTIGDRFTYEPPRIEFLVGAGRAGSNGFTLSCQMPEAAEGTGTPTGGNTSNHCPAGTTGTSAGKLIFPDDSATLNQVVSSYGNGSLAGQHLTVKGYNTGAVKLKWTLPGLSGSVGVLHPNGSDTITFNYEDGILVGATKSGNDPVLSGLEARWNPNIDTYVSFVETLQDPCADAYAGNASNGSNRDANGDPS
tara:strand:+ start:24807 stop:27557 length:2751 start_codon:yes stop_codon:yes gene_type:complete